MMLRVRNSSKKGGDNLKREIAYGRGESMWTRSPRERHIFSGKETFSRSFILEG